MTQRLIHSYSEAGDLEYVIVRLFDMLGDRLEIIPRQNDVSLIERLRSALLRDEPAALPIRERDLRTQTFIYVPDAAECIGRIAVRIAGRPLKESIDLGNPDNQAAPVDLVRAVLARYREQYGSGGGALTQFVEDRPANGGLPRAAQGNLLADRAASPQ